MRSPTTARRSASASVLVVVLAGCGTMVPTPTNPWPIDPSAANDPVRMAVEPATASAGEEVALTFPAAHERGILFAIDASVPGGWERRALLISDANAGAPIWFSPGDEDAAVDMVGIGGEGPDHVTIPEGLPAGEYRICTANAVENLCVPLELVAP